MGEKNKKMAKNAMLYSFFTLLQRGLGIFLLPLYTTVLSSSQLGIISTSTAVIAFFVIIFGLSLRGSTTYFYYNHNKDNQYLKEVYGISVTLILLISSVGIALLLVFKQFLLDILFQDIDFYPYIILSLVCMFLQPLYFYYQSLLKTKQLAKKAVMLDLLYFSMMIGFTIILILFFGFGAEGALIGNALASLAAFVLSLIGLRNETVFSTDIQILKRVLKYSLPILPHNLSGWAMNMFDKVILNNINSLSVVAYFDVGSQIGKVVNMLSLGVNSAYSPWFFDQIKNHTNGKIQIAEITKKIILFYGLSGVAISWLSPEILMIISKPEYHQSWKIVPIISTAFIINGFYFTFSNIFFLNKTKYLPLLTLSGALFNIILNFSLIPLYGIFGAAFASLLTKILFTIIAYKVSRYILLIDYDIAYISSIIIVSFLISAAPYLVQSYLEQISIWLSILIKVLFLIVLVSPFIYLNRDFVRSLMKKDI